MKKKFLESKWFSLIIVIGLSIMFLCAGFQMGYVKGVDETYNIYKNKCANVTSLAMFWNSTR